jgi:hypothetical protein
MMPAHLKQKREKLQLPYPKQNLAVWSGTKIIIPHTMMFSLELTAEASINDCTVAWEEVKEEEEARK